MLKFCRYGLIGAGMMGQEHIRNIALIEGAEVTAVFEPDEGMRAAAAGIAQRAAFTETLEGLLSTPDLDCLVIASPNNLHAAQFKTIAAARPLPILIEKPLYTDPSDVPGIKRLMANYPSPAWVAMEYRYMPPIARMLELAESVTGGIRMLSIREHRFPFLPKIGAWNRFNKNTGGTLVEKCCHFFDLMRLMLRDEPVRVMASGGQAVNHLDEAYYGEKPDIWDNAYVIVEFAGGARAMLELCMFAEGSHYQEEVSAVGPSGKIECFVPGPSRFRPADEPAPTPKVVLSPREGGNRETIDVPIDPVLLDAGDHNGATYYQHLRFLEAVRGHAEPEVTLDDGARAVAMGLAAHKSAQTGRVVEL